MQIKKLKLENFRGIKEQEIELLANINVFVGINGAGKSTILDAISISLSWLVNRIQKARANGLTISTESIKNGTNYSSITLEILENDEIYSWKNITSLEYEKKERSNFKQVTKLASFYRKISDKNKKLPMIAYYPINRITKGKVNIPYNQSISQFDIYDNALGGIANFQAFFEWFRLKDDIINELSHSRGEIFYDIKKELKIITKTIEKFIPEYSNLRVTRIPTPRMLVDKNGETLNLNQLSDGEKNMIAMIGDIARRLSMANPNLENPLEGDGIVMIDEVDLHLHPSWQRVIVSKLVEIFPNCQFIITTHSPQILSHVKADHIFLLQQEDDNISVIKPTESFGKSSDRQLEDILGVEARPLEIKKELHRLFKLIQSGSLKDAKQLMTELENEIEGREPELVKANVLIKRKEILGR